MKNTTRLTKGYLLIAFTLLISNYSNATVFSNTSSINVLDGVAASPYSSNITVSGMTGTISTITLTLNNVTHDYIQDMSVILQAPDGKALLVQSGAADGYSVSHISYTFSDAAASQFSAITPLISGTYKPTAYFWDIFPLPAPYTPPGVNTYFIPGPFNAGLPLSTLTSTFGGSAPNGTWKLWVADFSAGDDPGVIAGGWSMNITTTVAPPNYTLNLKLFLQGFYSGSSLMKAVLQNQGIIGAGSSITDSITVELRNSSAPYALIASKKVILNTDGTASAIFSTAGNYYVVVRHRNTIQTWSATPVTIGTSAVTYNFSNAQNKAYGNNQIQVSAGIYAFYTGDLNGDENIDIGDLTILENDISAFAFGYRSADTNGDGNVDTLDDPVLNSNLLNFVSALHP